MWPRVHLHKPKMLILQNAVSNVWKSANHTVFMQIQNTVEKRFNLLSPAIWTKYNILVMKNN